MSVLLSATLLLASGLPAAELPNIVLILADDQGWTGTSVQMHPSVRGSASDLYRTPNLERLAAQGMRFSNGYAPAPNCSPTRMSIQTGKTAPRLGASDIIDVVPQGGDDFGGAFYNNFYVNKPLNVHLPISDLPDEELTIAELLKERSPDYRTAHFGKWHMGGGSPDRHGYDDHSGPTTNAPGRNGEPDPKRTGEVTRQAVEFIWQYAKQQPFFIQVSYYAVHTPILAKGETIDQYSTGSSGQHMNRAYAAMTDELDQGLGRILDQIESSEIGENTYVIYTSDNGGEISGGVVTNNAPLAKGKTSVWEGGVRVPLIVSGPDIEAGTQSDVPVIGYDFLPTIAAWAGATDRLPDNLDGGSLISVLENSGKGRVKRGTESLIWYYGAYRNNKHVSPQAAIRRGAHKLIWEFESDRTILFDLGLDISETTDLSRFRPEVAKSMHEELRNYFKSVDAKLPTVNPNYDPAKDPGLSANLRNRRFGNRRQPGTRNGRRPPTTRPPSEQ
ncbi:MAG: sulfatase [Planctomycetota bacterium]